MEVLADHYYTKDHEWVSFEEDIATIGITDYAQSSLGDITFIELPAVGSEVDQFEQVASVESVKAANDVFSPMSGKVIEVNAHLESEPGLINKNCFETGWIAKIAVSSAGEKSNLMTADEYRSYLESLE